MNFVGKIVLSRIRKPANIASFSEFSNWQPILENLKEISETMWNLKKFKRNP